MAIRKKNGKRIRPANIPAQSLTSRIFRNRVEPNKKKEADEEPELCEECGARPWGCLCHEELYYSHFDDDDWEDSYS